MTAMAMIPGVLSQDARTYFEELLDVRCKQKSVSRTAPQGRELADSKRLLKYRSFPGFGRGFDSHRRSHPNYFYFLQFGRPPGIVTGRS